MNNKVRVLLKNSIYIFTGSIGSKIITFLMLPLYTRWLTPSEYGLGDLISSYSMILVPILSFCVSEAIFVYPKNRIKKIQSSFFTSGLIFVGSIFLIFLIIILFLENYLKILNPIFEYIWFIYFISILSFLSTFLQQFSRAINMIKVYASAGITQVIISTIFSFLLIPQYGLLGLLFCQLISLLGVCIYLNLKTKAITYLNFNFFSKKRLNVILRYSAPLIPNSIIFIVIAYINRPIIDLHLGPEFLGLFSVSEKFPSILLMIISIFMYSWQISATDEYGKNGYEEFYNIVLRSGFFILIGVGLILTFFSYELIENFIGLEFLNSWKYIPVLVFSPPLVFISSIVGVNFLVTKKTKYFFISSFCGGIAALIFNLILIPNFGLYGACVSIIFSQLIIMLVRVFFTNKIVSINGIEVYIISYVLLVLTSITTINYQSEMISKIIFILSLISLILLNIRLLKKIYININKIKSFFHV